MAETVTWDGLRDLAAFQAKKGCAISLYVNLDPSVAPTAGDADARFRSLLHEGERRAEANSRGLTHNQRVGLKDDRPYLLYVCSALFWGSPVEAEFVRRWVQSLRESAHPELREVGVLIRPHPARMDEWAAIDLSPYAHVTLYGSNPVDAASKDDYFESLFYSSAVVGLNTSAFLEGAVVGRPVHTVLLPEFQENQEGVLHFHYLLTVGGGVLQTGRTFEAHHDRLLESLRHPAAAPGAGFVREFIRPAGLDVAW